MMEYEKPDRKELILDAAEKLFSEMGYDSTSTRMIAAKANVNMAMLNYYFGSKDGLYKAVLERRLVFNKDEDLSGQEKDAWDRLHQWLDDHIENVFADTTFQRLIHRELSLQQRSDMTDFITDGLIRNVNELKRIISTGIKSGEFKEVDIELTVASILGTEYYIVNSSHIAGKILNKDLQNHLVIQDEIKPRLKIHLNELLDNYLKI